ncbi:MAG TPA: hypothetical protein VD932_06425, partial [Aquabacterium sp.]|nr:hypothetical protein [Aquabacterium sp.]
MTGFRSASVSARSPLAWGYSVESRQHRTVGDGLEHGGRVHLVVGQGFDEALEDPAKGQGGKPCEEARLDLSEP